MYPELGSADPEKETVYVHSETFAFSGELLKSKTGMTEPPNKISAYWYNKNSVARIKKSCNQYAEFCIFML